MTQFWKMRLMAPSVGWVMHICMLCKTFPPFWFWFHVCTSIPSRVMSKNTNNTFIGYFWEKAICGLAGENRPTGAKFPGDNWYVSYKGNIWQEFFYWLFLLYKSWPTFWHLDRRDTLRTSWDMDPSSSSCW